MPKIIIILIFLFFIFILTYLSSKENTSKENKLKKAAKVSAISSAIVAVLNFAGPYIVDYFADSGKETNNESQSENYDNESQNPDDNLQDNKDDPPIHEHKIKFTEKENICEATCINPGSYDEVFYCECGEIIKKESRTIEALGHNYIAAVTDPSCNETGFTTHTCTSCHDTYVDNSTEALGHDFIMGLCSRCGTISPDYEAIIISKVNELLNSHNYEEALNVVNEALCLLESDSLLQLRENVYAEQAAAVNSTIYTANPVQFITYSGTIKDNNDTDTYSLTASANGHHRFDLKDMINGFIAKLYVYDSSGNNVGGTSSIENGRGITCTLEKGHTYSIEIKSRNGAGNYNLIIGQPKDAVEITTKDVVYDSIEYSEQLNYYTFTAPIDGIYRFDMSDMINGFNVKLYVYDALEYQVGGFSCIGNNQGVTVTLKAGETYTLQVVQRDNLGSYTLTVRRQQPVQDISDVNNFRGTITYQDQDNEYIYTPSYTGAYNFTLQNMVSGFEVKFYIYDALGYQVAGRSSIGNGGTMTADLNAGERYTIHIIHRFGFNDYEVNISK